MSINIKVIDNSPEFIKELERRIPIAMEACGLLAEGYAKRLCRVDTGLLRNSITHALGGGSTAISYYTDNEGKQSGSYSGTMPADKNYIYNVFRN